MAAAGGDGGGRGRGASRCYVTLKAPTCGISISIDLCGVCGGAVYQKVLFVHECVCYSSRLSIETLFSSSSSSLRSFVLM